MRPWSSNLPNEAQFVYCTFEVDSEEMHHQVNRASTTFSRSRVVELRSGNQKFKVLSINGQEPTTTSFVLPWHE